MLRRGSRQRQRAETGLNYNSSRSHSIFTVSGASRWDGWTWARLVDSLAGTQQGEGFCS